MSINQIFAAAQGGAFYKNIGDATGLDVGDVTSALTAFAPAIAVKLKDKAAADPESFEQLLDLIEDGDGSDINDPDAICSSEAVSDGREILEDLYGSAPPHRLPSAGWHRGWIRQRWQSSGPLAPRRCWRPCRPATCRALQATRSRAQTRAVAAACCRSFWQRWSKASCNRPSASLRPSAAAVATPAIMAAAHTHAPAPQAHGRHRRPVQRDSRRTSLR